ncbi:permease prefix domain 1-containing protein [Streptomyces sp. NBC_01142]|uniref:permease prefix domain 1-containing protein n=1 Tax=Streptomyces sp. NBC_01142 TaxID=2975865 RepID=UPI00225287C2|nr:permease prefix domain 1-containing protein [Streptomyces sp. NBC_01142]MCX4820466.1 permease prefix domain 1-containing protein [Streptomyces sp. NBC_01142]
MNAIGRQADPIEDYVAALTAALHGPARAKARMIEEIHDGLADTVAAHTSEGTPYPRAAHQAVGEFGTPDELAPICQRELTIAQARHTARAVALTAPFLIACWYVARTADHGQSWQLPRMAQLLAVHLAGVATGAALLAAATLATTGTLARRLPTPHGLPVAVAWTGTTASVAMAVATLALATASVLATNWPLLAFAAALAAASHGVVAASARACRRCARLPTNDRR